ncbi:phasin family protein [Paraburkholderia diazotrophica]|uniref:Phasin family protein n=1 Tax=Paraburkholderia diazotrophica TaxID=667676 RepID=A0A1H7E5H7_9BURK|nr:phasin family protein [Paraburkholderia diazotrophica]SEK07322.1 phasin family protein [Paraburkholderia diazotrophica]
MSTPDLKQPIAAQKASLEAMFDVLNKALASIEKLASLNLQVFKSTIASSQEIATRTLSTKDPRELFELQAGQAQPAVEKAQSYWRDVYEIESGTLADFTETLDEQFKRYQHDWQAFLENLAKNAPTGSEAALSAWTSTIETASATFETARKATKRAARFTEGNVTAALEAPTDVR